MTLLFTMGMASIFLALSTGACSFLRTYYSTRIGHSIVHALRLELLSHVQRLSLSFHSRNRSGELLTKISHDTRSLKGVFSELTLNALSHIVTLLGMLLVMIVLNWRLTLILLGTIPVLCYVLLNLNQRIQGIVSRQRREEGKMASRLNEVLNAIPLVQAFGREGFEKEQFEKESVKNLKAGMGAAKTEAAGSLAVHTISAAGTAITLMFGAWQVLLGHLTPGELLIFVSYVRRVYRPFRHLTKLSAQFSRARISMQRIREVLDQEPEIQDHPNAIHVRHLKGDIRFDRVSFSYGPGDPVLDRVSFHIQAGQHVALVGPSGAGKSTIVSLLLRLYQPQSGAILIDGVNVAAYHRESLLKAIGIVLQDSTLFGSTVRENIAYGKPHATFREIQTAAKQAHAHEFISHLSHGYDTVIGERGCMLSGGERQRLALARALIKTPSILVFDEPTSAVDAVSASLMWKAIHQTRGDKTVLVIAHHFTYMEAFDQILVLKNGHIVEHGPHHRLLGLKGYYHELYQHQLVGR